MLGCSGDRQPARWALVCPSLTPNPHTSPDQWPLRILHLGPCHPPGTQQQTQPPLGSLMHQRPRSGAGWSGRQQRWKGRDGKADGSGEAKRIWASTQPARCEGQAQAGAASGEGDLGGNKEALAAPGAKPLPRRIRPWSPGSHRRIEPLMGEEPRCQGLWECCCGGCACAQG